MERGRGEEGAGIRGGSRGLRRETRFAHLDVGLSQA